jgi:hypothetical protein
MEQMTFKWVGAEITRKKIRPPTFIWRPLYDAYHTWNIDGRMIHGWWIGEYSERRGHDLAEVLSRIFLKGTEKNREKSQCYWFPDLDSSRPHAEYESRTLPLANRLDPARIAERLNDMRPLWRGINCSIDAEGQR